MIKRNLNKLDLVFLVGGKGSRISKITKKKPKPLIKAVKNPKFILSKNKELFDKIEFEIAETAYIFGLEQKIISG